MWLAWLMLALSARPGFVPVVGRAEGLSVVIVKTAGQPEERHGDLLPMTARRTDQAGELELRHSAALAPITRAGFLNVTQWLRGPGTALIPDLSAALGRCGVVVMPDTEPAPMDGSSASVAMTVAATSALLDLPVLQNVAFTGAVAPDGSVTVVGGVPDKLRGALRGRLDTLVAPRPNAEQALATLSIEDLGRIRIVAVNHLREALPEGFGPVGPWGKGWQEAQDELAHGIAHLAEDHVADAAAALNAYRALAPRDLTAALWLDAAAGRHIAAPVRAAALRFACRYDDAIAVCREPQVTLAASAALAAIADQCRRDRAADQRDLLLAESHAALAAGDLAKARARLDEAAKTLALEPGGADAVAWQTAELRLAESRMAVKARPEDVAAWRELAAQAQTRRQWREAAEAWRRVGELADAERRAAYRQALCWFRVGEWDQARLVLLGNLLNWPADTAGRDLLTAMGTDVDAPRPVAIVPARPAGTVMLQGGCDEAGVTTWLTLDERDLTRGQGRLAASWDTTASASGPHLLSAVACDRAGNWGLAQRVVEVSNGATRPTVFIEAAPRAAPPMAVHVLIGGEVRLRHGDTLVLHPDRLVAPLLKRAQRPAGDLRVAATWGEQRALPASGPVRLEPADTAREVGLHGQFANGTALAPVSLRLRWTEELPGQLVSHPEATRVRLEVRPPRGFRPVLAALVVDGVPGPWQLPSALSVPRGAREVSAVLLDADQVACQTTTLDVAT